MYLLNVSYSQLQKLLSEDSYARAEVVDYEILDFDCKVTSPDLKALTNS